MEVVPPGEVWRTWNADPLIALPLLAAAWAYWRGVERIWHRTGRGRVVSGWQVGSFAAGLVVVAAATLSPLDALAHTLFAAHMAQHLLLVLLAGPLLALGTPGVALGHGMPVRLRPSVHRLRPPARWRRRLSAPGGVVALALVHVAVLWVWHVPALYEAALRHALVHAVEHATMLGSALMLWVFLVGAGSPRRRARPVGALAIFLVATFTVGLGMLLTLTPQPWFPAHEAGARLWSVSPLADQQLGGALMWTVGGPVYMISGATVFGLWLARAAPRQPRGGAAPDLVR